MRGRMRFAFVGLVVGAAALAGNARADDPGACKEVVFSDVGWSCITATTAVATTILDGLGYEPKATVLSVPVTFASLSNGDIDAFLGLWLPTQQSMIDPYFADGSVEKVGINLEGAKYTLAVPSYVYEGGVKSFGDIAKHADKFDNKNLRHRARQRRQPDHSEHDRHGRVRSPGLRGRRIERAGHAVPGRAGSAQRRVDRLPGLGAPSHEPTLRDELSRGRRRPFRDPTSAAPRSTACRGPATVTPAPTSRHC